MSGLGFGLERLGLFALSRPLVFTILITVVTAILASFVPFVKFNGNVTAVIPKSSESYINYQTQHDDFRNFSRDVAVIIRSPRLKTASGLEDLRELELELSIADGASAAFSMFSIPSINSETGEIERFFPTEVETDAEVSALLERLLNEYPQAGNLVSGEENAVLLLVALDLETAQGNDAKAFAAFKSIVEVVEEYKPDDFEALYAGLTPIGITILETLIKDQVRLTLLGLLAGAVVALLFFRCAASAFLCAIPPILTALCSIGLFGLINVPITYLTTILPTLALILAYADGIVLHHRWMRLNREADPAKLDALGNLRFAVLQVGPASALTTITTAAAIGTFLFSSSEALFEFGWLGVVLVFIAFLTVIITLPVTGYWFAKFGILRTSTGAPKTALIGRLANSVYGSAPGVISFAGLILIGLFFLAHTRLQPDYRITDYLPRASQTLEAERIANEIFGGRSLIFFSIPVVEEGGIVSAENRNRLGEVTTTLFEAYGARRVFSMHSFIKDHDVEATKKIAEKLQNASQEIRQGYISRDDSKMLVSLRVSSDQSIVENAVLLKELEENLSGLPYAGDIVITGFPVLLAVEFTKIIDELRLSLLGAILVGVVLIGFATRSVFFALVTAVPNLFPVLFVEMLIYMKSGNINVTEVVALTIAFGIAIDNAVHVINMLQSKLSDGDKSLNEALRLAILEVAPALAGSTLIICTATAVILTSILPILTIVGTLIIVILVVALITNLVLLPANILTIGKLTGRI